MRFLSFAIITLLALLYAGLTVAETIAYQTWEQKAAEQRQIQSKVADVQRVKERVRELLTRMAYESQRDPAILKLLKDHRINVNPIAATPDPTQAVAPAPAAPPTSQNPAPAHP